MAANLRDLDSGKAELSSRDNPPHPRKGTRCCLNWRGCCRVETRELLRPCRAQESPRQRSSSDAAQSAGVDEGEEPETRGADVMGAPWRGECFELGLEGDESQGSRQEGEAFQD